MEDCHAHWDGGGGVDHLYLCCKIDGTSSINFWECDTPTFRHQLCPDVCLVSGACTHVHPSITHISAEVSNAEQQLEKNCREELASNISSELYKEICDQVVGQHRLELWFGSADIGDPPPPRQVAQNDRRAKAILSYLAHCQFSVHVSACLTGVFDQSPPKSAKKSQQIGGTHRRTNFSAKQVPSALDLSQRLQTHLPFGCFVVDVMW